MRYDLLSSEFKQVVAVNCKVEGDNLSAGYVYFELQTPKEIVVESADGDSFKIEVPEEFALQSTPKICLETSLKLL